MHSVINKIGQTEEEKVMSRTLDLRSNGTIGASQFPLTPHHPPLSNKPLLGEGVNESVVQRIRGPRKKRVNTNLVEYSLVKKKDLDGRR